jgi:hypothetical protein
MSSLLIILALVAIVLLFVGGFVQAVQWLLWIGIILLIIAAIMWLVRYIGGRSTKV